jgi:DNA-binding CsgD family transcriptional regulator
MAHKIFSALQEQLPVEAFESLLNPEPTLCFGIKHQKHGYVYANQNFIRLMGFSDLRKMLHKKDQEICSDENLLKVYREYDEEVYDTQQSISIEGVVKPDDCNFEKTMRGKSLPFSMNGSHIDSVIFMHKPVNQVLSLDLETLITTPLNALKEYLINKSYPISFKHFQFSLTRMELLCFAELLKGKHAGEIAESIGIKQLTVESYLANLRNKCGVCNKSELIQFFINNPVIENIIV